MTEKFIIRRPSDPNLVIQIFKMYYIQYMIQICDGLCRLVMGFVLIAEVLL